MAIHPSESKLLVAAGGKWGSVGFWDVEDTTSEMHGVHVIKVRNNIKMVQTNLKAVEVIKSNILVDLFCSLKYIFKYYFGTAARGLCAFECVFLKSYFL